VTDIKLTNREGFFNKLYQNCDGQIEVRLLPSGLQRYFDIEDQDSIDDFCNANGKQNVFFGVATRDGKGGTKENIVNIPALWADVDFKDTPIEEARNNLKGLGKLPSITVQSGFGVHLYWILKEPAGEEDIEKVEDINRRIAHVLQADDAAVDAARILRVPDTLNHKYDPAEKVRCVDIKEFQYNLDDFENLPECPHKVAGGKSVNPVGWFGTALKGVPDGMRGTVATKISGLFHRYRVPPRIALTILLDWNTRNEPPMAEVQIFTTYRSIGKNHNGGTDDRQSGSR